MKINKRESLVVEDIKPKRSIRRRLALITLILVSICGAAIGSVWTYKNVYEIYKLRQTVKDALKLVSVDPSYAEAIRLYPSMSEAQVAYDIALQLSSSKSVSSSTRRNQLIGSSLELSQRLGYVRGYWLEALLAKEGDIGVWSDADIKKKTDIAISEAIAGSKNGNLSGTIAYIEMLIRGFGDIAADKAKSSKMLLNIATELNEYDFTSLYFSSDSIDDWKTYASEYHRRGLNPKDLGHSANYACRVNHEDPKSNEYGTSMDELTRYFLDIQKVNRKIAECLISIFKPYSKSNPTQMLAVLAANSDALEIYSQNSMIDLDKGKIAHQSVQSLKLPPQSGYIDDESSQSHTGLSSFEVDNTKTSRDAVVRIYLNGRKPAYRSMLIKAGEKFTAKNLAPGNYILRYRFSDSTKTFEAKDTFSLTEEKTESGTRFSKITVTLYKTKDGNMQTSEVSADEF